MKRPGQVITSVNTLANMIQLIARSTRALVGDGVDAKSVTVPTDTDAMNDMAAAQIHKAMKERGMLK